MNREIKFRAWHPIMKEMYYDCICGGFKETTGLLPKYVDGHFEEWVNLDGSEILMQFTGLKDKNGKKLDWWEGDLFKHHVTDYLLVLVFEDGCFWFKTSTGQIRYKCYDVMEWGDLPEKVGNVQSDPELIKNE